MRKIYKPYDRIQKNAEIYKEKKINLGDELNLKRDENDMESIDEYWEIVNGVIGNDTIELIDMKKRSLKKVSAPEEQVNETLFDLDTIRKSIRLGNRENQLKDKANNEDNSILRKRSSNGPTFLNSDYLDELFNKSINGDSNDSGFLKKFSKVEEIGTEEESRNLIFDDSFTAQLNEEAVAAETKQNVLHDGGDSSSDGIKFIKNTEETRQHLNEGVSIIVPTPANAIQEIIDTAEQPADNSTKEKFSDQSTHDSNVELTNILDEDVTNNLVADGFDDNNFIENELVNDLANSDFGNNFCENNETCNPAIDDKIFHRPIDKITEPLKNNKQIKKSNKKGSEMKTRRFDDGKIQNSFKESASISNEKQDSSQKILKEGRHSLNAVNIYKSKKLNRLNSLVNTKEINTGLINMKYNSMIENEFAEKEFSIFVEKGKVEIKVSRKNREMCGDDLKRGDIVVIKKNSTYSLKCVSINGARIIMTFAI